MLLMTCLPYCVPSEEGVGSLLFVAAPNFAGLASPGGSGHQGRTKLKFISDAPVFFRGTLLQAYILSHPV